MPPRHAPDMSYRPTAKAEWKTIRTLLPYLWPRGEWTIRARVVIALVCLVIAKLATVIVPVLYKEAVDVISAEGAFVVTALVGILVGYGISRVAQQGFAELRDFFFARVGQRAIRAVGLKTFHYAFISTGRQVGSPERSSVGSRASSFC